MEGDHWHCIRPIISTHVEPPRHGTDDNDNEIMFNCCGVPMGGRQRGVVVASRLDVRTNPVRCVNVCVCVGGEIRQVGHV